MPNWKKVLLSGSKASVYDITASNLPSEISANSDVITVDANGRFQIANRSDFGGGASGPNRAVQFAYTEDGGTTFLLSGSEFLLFDEVERELIISASGEGAINIGRDGGISNGDVLGSLNFIGTGSAIIEGPSAIIRAKAIQDFSANTKGAKLEFFVADNQETTLSNGVPELTISGSIVSSSVKIKSPTLETDNISILDEGNITFENIPSNLNGIHGIVWDEQTNYGARVVYDSFNDKLALQTLQNSVYKQGIQIHRSNGNVQIGGSILAAAVSPPNKLTVEGSISASGDLNIDGNATIVGTAAIDDIEIIGAKIEDADNPNCFAQFNGDLTLASPTDVRIIIDSDDNDGSAIFEVMNDGADELNASSLFSINQSGNVTVTGTVDGRDIAADGTKLDLAAAFTASLDPDLATFSVPASTTISAFGKTLVDDIDNSAARTTLGVRIGTDVQAYNATLAAVAGGTYTGDDSITTVGTIGTGTWQGDVIASAYLDGDTAHLSGTQTFSGTKTFSSTLKASGKIEHTGDTDTYISFATDQIDFYAGNIRMLTLDETTQDTVVINENSADVDFRVEGNNDSHALFVQGSDDHVGIGTSTPNTKLHVVDNVGGSDDSFVATFENPNSSPVDTGAIRLIINHSATTFYPYQGGADADVGLVSSNAPRFIQFENTNGVSGYIRAGGQDGMNTSIVNTSDRRYKTNIEDLDTGLDAILKTRPVSFNWKKSPNSPKLKGFIAQEIKEILPETVDYDVKEDKYYMSDTALIPTLVKAIQDQQKIIDSLEARLNKLEQL